MRYTTSTKRAAGAVAALVVLTLLGLTASGCRKDSSDKPDKKGSAPRPSGKGHSFRYTGPVPTTFQEAPQLAKLVAEGKLPPVAERLPKDVLVVPPIEKIGRYGGTWRRAFTGPADGQNSDRLMHDHVLYYDLDGITVMPHVVRDWKVSDGARTFTFFLRRGMRWSDGHPFTADDFVFAFDDLILNRDLHASAPAVYVSPGGKPGRLTKIDLYTVKIEFPDPFHVFPEMLGALYVAGQSARGDDGSCLYVPKHYLKQFLPKYTKPEELQARIAKAKLGTWKELYRLRADAHLNPDLPVIGPWIVVSPINGDMYSFRRNPYYWAVDPKGNQLPYIDRIEMRLAANPEVLNMRAMAGELDMQHRHIHLAKTPSFKEHGKKNGYDVLFWRGTAGSDCAVYINHSYEEDPEVANWLHSTKFRIALSHAVDRDEINDSIFLGTGGPKSCVPPPGMPHHPGVAYEKKYAALDLDKANRILDELGLKKKDSEGFRLRTDGKGRLDISLLVVASAFLDFPGIAELLSRHWRQVGLSVTVEQLERTYAGLRQTNNKHQMTLWSPNGAENIWSGPRNVVPCWPRAAMGPRFGLYYSTGGRDGMEPTGPSKTLLDLYHKGKSTPREQRIELGKELWRTVVDSQYFIGLVDGTPAFNGVVIVRNNFRNVPLTAPNTSAIQNPGIARTEQFFFED